MRLLILSTFILALFCAGGCGHVAGNYPVEKIPTEKNLPEKFQNRGQGKKLAWREDGAIHGFIGSTKPAVEMVELMRGYAQQGNAQAARDAKIFEPMARSGLVFAPMRVFVARGAQRRIEQGDFLVTFADGTSTPDKGALLYPIMGKTGAPKSSLGGVINLNQEGDPDLKGRALYLFFAKEYLERAITSIELVDVVAGK